MTPTLSFILATHNRRDVVLHTLARIAECGLPESAYEVIVVDNASADGTPDAIERQFPDAQVLRLRTNRGPCSKNAALPHARGKFYVFLDDDSYPVPGAVVRMIWHFQRNPQLGAASFTVRRPDGTLECSAYPNVFIGCGVGLRRDAIRQVGALPDDFFMQAEEYDLSLRLLDRGWEVRWFDDIEVIHEKSPVARCSSRTMRLDVRNNLLVATRRFPEPFIEPYVKEWMTRYWAIAAARRRRWAAIRGFVDGSIRSIRPGTWSPVSEQAFETFSRINETRARMIQFQRQTGARRVLLIDWGKNLYAYRLACEAAGLNIVGIADPKLAGQKYRQWRVCDDRAALQLEFDAAIVANLSPVHAADRLATWRRLTPLPVCDLFEESRSAVRVAAA